jgi:hypothetical protein
MFAALSATASVQNFAANSELIQHTEQQLRYGFTSVGMLENE